MRVPGPCQEAGSRTVEIRHATIMGALTGLLLTGIKTTVTITVAAAAIIGVLVPVNDLSVLLAGLKVRVHLREAEITGGTEMMATTLLKVNQVVVGTAEKMVMEVIKTPNEVHRSMATMGGTGMGATTHRRTNQPAVGTAEMAAVEGAMLLLRLSHGELPIRPAAVAGAAKTSTKAGATAGPATRRRKEALRQLGTQEVAAEGAEEAAVGGMTTHRTTPGLPTAHGQIWISPKTPEGKSITGRGGDETRRRSGG